MQVIHGVMGGVSCGMYSFHFFLGVFRMKNPKRRRIQIFLHWFFGLFNYLLASEFYFLDRNTRYFRFGVKEYYLFSPVGTMVVAAFIQSGCMGCATLIIICVWLVIQITMYVVMEV
jgi:hypothetical protein